jgi:hypothetical protein
MADIETDCVYKFIISPYSLSSTGLLAYLGRPVRLCGSISLPGKVIQCGLLGNSSHKFVIVKGQRIHICR